MIGAAANDPASVAVANTAADQLRSVGIAATVQALDPVTLYGPALAKNKVDAIVGWHAAGGDLATVLASRYGCPALETAPVSAAPTPPHPQLRNRPARPSSNLKQLRSFGCRPTWTGICDRAIQPEIAGALDGTLGIDRVISAVEPRLWAMSAVLPIMQDTTIVAAGPSVRNVSLTGAVPVGIVADAGNWVKVPQ